MKYIIILMLFSTSAFAQKTIYPMELIEEGELNAFYNAISDPRIRCECETDSADGVVTVSTDVKSLQNMHDDCMESTGKFYMTKTESGAGITSLTQLVTCRSVIGTQGYVASARSMSSGGSSASYQGLYQEIQALKTTVQELRNRPATVIERSSPSTYSAPSTPNTLGQPKDNSWYDGNGNKHYPADKGPKS
jgi:hypothetical protein